MTLPGGDYAERFWSKVQKGDGCWEWQASRTSHGYGQVSTFRRPRGAHRVAWELTHGPIPDGLFVCHRCDNPPCVRPDHLYLATSGENTRDAAAHGLTHVMRGTESPRAKLTEDDIREIRRRRLAGELLREIGARFGIHTARVSLICARKQWSHVE